MGPRALNNCGPIPVRYAELHCLSNFTFLRGASHPEEQVKQAARLGYTALALTDECSLAGIVRGHAAARELPLQYIVGTELRLEEGVDVVVLASSRESYGALAALISHARRAAPKGSYKLNQNDFGQYLDATDSPILWLPGKQPALAHGTWLRDSFSGRVWLAVELFLGGRDRRLLELWRGIARQLDLPMVASGNVHMHSRERRRMQDVLTAIRLGVPLE